MATNKTPRSRACSPQRVRSWVSDNKLLLITFAAIILGVVLGLCLRLVDLPYDAQVWISIWGELFMRMLKCIILPLVSSCLVVGVSSLESSAGGFLGAISLGYIFGTQLIGVLTGIILAVAIHPGAFLNDPPAAAVHTVSYSDVFADFLRNLFPENIIQACIQNAFTNTTEQQITVQFLNASDGNATVNATQMDISRKLLYRDGMNTMGVTVFSLALGFGISATGPAGRPLLRVFQGLNAVILKVMDVVIMYAPLGIMSLIATALIKVEDLDTVFSSLAMLVVTTMVGSVIHILVFLPLLCFVFTRRNPYPVLFHFLDAMFAAFAPPSSVAGLPFLLVRCRDQLHLDERVIKFFLPIAVTMNRDSSAMFICVAAIFVAQTYGIVLGIGQYLILGLLVTMLSAAVAAVPSSSIFVLLMASTVLQIPVAERIGLLMTVEWITDRFRTMGNVSSHGYGCVIVARLCRTRLGTPEQEEKGSASPISIDEDGEEESMPLMEQKDSPQEKTRV